MRKLVNANVYQTLLEKNAINVHIDGFSFLTLDVRNATVVIMLY